MGDPCQVECGDCSNICNDGGVLDIEDMEKELSKLQARTKELEALMTKVRGDEHSKPKKTKLRSSDWFNRKGDLGMTALYVERYLNTGFTREELMSGKPIIGIAQSGSDIAPVSALPFLSLPCAFNHPPSPPSQSGMRPINNSKGPENC